MRRYDAGLISTPALLSLVVTRRSYLAWFSGVIIQGCYPARFIPCGYPARLSGVIISRDYPKRLSGIVIQGGYPSWLSDAVI